MTDEIELSKKQQEAVDAVVAWYDNFLKGNRSTIKDREFYLAGHAGSGKTTIAKYIVNVLKEKYKLKNIVTCAYMGKAVDVLRKKGMPCCSTIHRLIYKPYEDPKTKQVKFDLAFIKDLQHINLIILDECSMIGEKMLKDLRYFGKPMLILGDPGQLPPIQDTGFVTNRKPDFMLDEIHRQAEKSPIIQLSIKIRNGDIIKPGIYGDDVYVVNGMNKDIYNKYILNRHFQPICGMNKTRYSVNRAYRKALKLDRFPYPQANEKIIIKKNNIDLALFNGMIGKTFQDSRQSKIHDNCVILPFQYESGRKVEFPTYKYIFDMNYGGKKEFIPYNKKIMEVDWAYCITCHASQGSEWNYVTVIDESSVFRENKQKWLYVAVTRAMKKLVLIL